MILRRQLLISGLGKFAVTMTMMLLSAIALKAQEKEYLFLKDRTEICGVISRQPDGGVSVVDQYGDEFVFAADEIRYIANQKQKNWAERIYRRKGYFGIVEASLGGAILDGSGAVFSIGVINGYKVSRYFYVGLGLGIGVREVSSYDDSYESYYYNVLEIPIYAHLRYSIIGGRNCAVSPYISSDIGVNNQISSQFDSTGVYFSPSLGVEIRSKRVGTFWVGLNFPMSFTYDGYIGMALRVGYSF